MWFVLRLMVWPDAAINRGLLRSHGETLDSCRALTLVELRTLGHGSESRNGRMTLPREICRSLTANRTAETRYFRNR